MKNVDDIPLIKPFIESNDFYVYDTNMNVIIKLPKNYMKEIKDILSVGIKHYIDLNRPTIEHEHIIQLIDKGYFQRSHVNSIEFGYIGKVLQIANRCIRHMILQVTKNCNFQCRYCPFASSSFSRNHKNENMEWSIAKKAIDFLYHHSMDAPEIIISFYGGEPMLNYNLIYKCIEYANSLFKIKKTKYSITCNGSILSDDMVSFLEANNVDLLISLDGPKYIQDRNRKIITNGDGSFDIVFNNIKTIMARHQYYFNKHIQFNPVIINKDEQGEIYDFFKNNFNIPVDKFSPSIADLSGTDYYTHYTNNDEDTDLFFNRSLETTKNNLSDKSEISSKYCHGGPCIPGFSKLMVSTTGDFYPCEKTNELNKAFIIGNVFNGFDSDSVLSLFKIVKLTEEQCKNCWQLRLCHICAMQCGRNDGKNGFSAEQKKIACEAQSKILISNFRKIVRAKK